MISAHLLIAAGIGLIVGMFIGAHARDRRYREALKAIHYVKASPDADGNVGWEVA